MYDVPPSFFSSNFLLSVVLSFCLVIVLLPRLIIFRMTLVFEGDVPKLLHRAAAAAAAAESCNSIQRETAVTNRQLLLANSYVS
jgi:hypothetical protein